MLDEPSAGLHPADAEALAGALERLKAAGNSVFVVEHDLDLIGRADWIVDMGPDAGERGGQVLYSGPPVGLRAVDRIAHRPLPVRGAADRTAAVARRRPLADDSGGQPQQPEGGRVRFPIGALTTVTGVSGSGKSSLVSHALADLAQEYLGQQSGSDDDDDGPAIADVTVGRLSGDLAAIRRFVRVDQRPIGRTPRSNLATYTGFFDQVRKLFAATPAARSRRYDAGRFSFNVAKGRCPHCEGEGFVMVELLFMPSVYAPCAECGGKRYNAKTLEIHWNGHTIADILGLTVDEACDVFDAEPAIRRPLLLLRGIGLGYLRLGQPATELSGGEAQRIKLATELQRMQRGETLYILDEPTAGLHALDVDRFMVQLHALVDAGNTVIVVEHDMRVAAQSDWIVDMGPGAGDEGGTVVATGTPGEVAASPASITARWLARAVA